WVMDGTSPTRVVLYVLGRDGRETPAAEFRHPPGGEVTVSVGDPVWGAQARRLFDDGVTSREHGRVVLRTEGAAFMRALVEPRLSTYSRLVDESEGTPG
ncbi:MAG: hypothetical protein ACRCSN_21985, partial [Dermatophilaceae bacterium]